MKKMQKASVTIEAAWIIPLLLGLFAVVITTLFYWHDKTVIGGVVWETAVVGAERKEQSEEQLQAYGTKLLQGKLLLFPRASVSVQKKEEKVLVSATAQWNDMKVTAESSMAITYPEREIRRKEKWSEHILQE